MRLNSHDFVTAWTRSLALGMTVVAFTLSSAPCLAGGTALTPGTQTVDSTCFSEAEAHGLCQPGLSQEPKDTTGVSGAKVVPEAQVSAAEELLRWIYGLMGIQGD